MFYKKSTKSALSLILLFSSFNVYSIEETENNLVTLDSGLQYKITQAPQDPSSARPRQGQKVEMHYTGWVQKTNKKFDSSIDRGAPFCFIVGRGVVIQGMEEAIRLMRVGEKRTFIIPPNLAYGAAGIRDKIPTNATLIFEIELLSIE